MQKTCYEELVERIVLTKDEVLFCSLVKEEYPKFSERGHSLKEFLAWVSAIEQIADMLNNHPEMSLNAVKEYARFNVETEVPCYRLTTKELQTVYEAEKFGAGEEGVLYVYEDAEGYKDVKAYPLMRLPLLEGDREDILVVFSGHHESAIAAVWALYGYVRRHRRLPFGVMFLGLEDNQNMTEFNPKFKLRKNSEYRMYLRQMLALGVPKELLSRLLMTPNDTSTAGNILLIADTLRKYGVHDANLICVTYPAYQMRVASELPWGLRQLGVGDVWVRLAMIPVKPTGMEKHCGLGGYWDIKRTFSYDQAENQLADLSVSNGVAHLFREQGKTRFGLPWLKDTGYPEHFKPLLPLFLAYSYPNVARELAGTNERVASVLKIIRTLMLDAYDKGVSGQVQDEQMVKSTEMTAHSLLSRGLVSKEILQRGCMMDSDEWLKKLKALHTDTK